MNYAEEEIQRAAVVLRGLLEGVLHEADGLLAAVNDLDRYAGGTGSPAGHGEDTLALRALLERITMNSGSEKGE